MDDGFTAPSSLPGQDDSRSSKAMLDAILTKAATADSLPTWHELYQDLLHERAPALDVKGQPTGRTHPRWDWRKSLYIAWHCTPRDKRWPKFEKDLATLLGLSNTRTMRHWREQDPEIGERIARLPAEMLLGHVADVFDALVQVAKDPDPKAHQDRKLFLEITGNYRPSGNVNLSMTPISYIEVPEDDDDDGTL